MSVFVFEVVIAAVVARGAGSFARRQLEGRAISRCSEPRPAKNKSVNEVSAVGRNLVAAAKAASLEIFAVKTTNPWPVG